MRLHVRSSAVWEQLEYPSPIITQGMGVGRIFSRDGPLGYFSKIFLGGAKSGEICFFLLKTKKTTFLC